MSYLVNWKETSNQSKTPKVDLLLRVDPPNPSFGGNAIQVGNVAIIIDTSLILILLIQPVVRSYSVFL